MRRQCATIDIQPGTLSHTFNGQYRDRTGKSVVNPSKRRSLIPAGLEFRILRWAGVGQKLIHTGGSLPPSLRIQGYRNALSLAASYDGDHGSLPSLHGDDMGVLFG